MKILLFPVEFPCIYGMIAFAISVFYGIQGILIKRHETHNENLKLKKEENKEWTLWERRLIHYSEYFSFNFVCGLAGFVALFVECKIFKHIGDYGDYSNIGGGTVALLVFLSLISIIGIAGKLSFVFYHGKIFGSKA